MDATNVAGEEHACCLGAGVQRDLRHAGTENVRRMDKAKRNLRRHLLRLAELYWLEILHARLRILLRVERQCWIVFRGLVAIVEFGVFFLQMSGVWQDDAA